MLEGFDSIFYFWFFIFGSIVGSFLNVCIVRLPEEKSVVFPGSHCPKCQQPIRWFDNIPMISFVVLMGQCRGCRANISPRYFLVELLTALSFVGFFHVFGFSWILVPYLIFVCGLIVATFVDFSHRIIPDEVSIGGMFVGLIFSAVFLGLHTVDGSSLIIGSTFARILGGFLLVMELGNSLIKNRRLGKEEANFVLMVGAFLLADFLAGYLAQMQPQWAPYAISFQASVQGAAVGGGIIYAMAIIGDILFRKETMGGGDVKLLAMIGAFLGWKMAVVTFFIAPFLGAVVGIVQKIRTQDSTIAYGPYLAVGAIIALFWGQNILYWVLYR